MPVLWTRARHPELGETVLPAAAMESYPEWEPVGEPSDNADGLRAAMAAEKDIRDAETPAPASPPRAAEKTTTVPNPEPAAPSGADQKE